MIRPEQVFLVMEPVDMRLGMDGLSAKIQLALGRSPCDGNGVWLCQRRLHQGSFVWPVFGDQVCLLTPQQWLIAGVDWRRLSATPLAERRV